MRNTFTKSERLTGTGKIQALFSRGSMFYVPPFRIGWMAAPDDEPEPVSVLMSVPKHRIPHAVDRNLIRRRMREAYRLHKHPLVAEMKQRPCHIRVSITYTSREILPYEQIEDKIIVLLQRLIKESEKVTR